MTDSISAPQGAARQRKQAVPGAAGAAAVAGNSKSSAPTAEQHKKEAIQPDANQKAVGAPNALPNKEGLQAQAAELTTLHRAPRLQDGTRQLPEDAMLILTRDLYL